MPARAWRPIWPWRRPARTSTAYVGCVSMPPTMPDSARDATRKRCQTWPSRPTDYYLVFRHSGRSCARLPPHRPFARTLPAWTPFGVDLVGNHAHRLPIGVVRPKLALSDQLVVTRGALVKVLDKPRLDLTSTIGQGLLAFLSAIAQDERERITKRAGEGRSAAKAAGRRFGRKPKLDEHQSAEARRRLVDGESFRAIARSYRVSHTTISRLGGA